MPGSSCCAVLLVSRTRGASKPASTSHSAMVRPGTPLPLSTRTLHCTCRNHGITVSSTVRRPGAKLLERSRRETEQNKSTALEYTIAPAIASESDATNALQHAS